MLNDLKRLYEKKDPVTVAPTIGKNHCKFKYQGVDYEFEDVGGAPNLRVYWSRYYPDTDAIVYVVDCSQQESYYKDCFKELNELLNHQDLQGTPTCICLNKMDICPRLGGVLSSAESFESLYKSHGFHFPDNRKIIMIDTVFSTTREHEYWKRKRSATRFGAQSKKQLDEEEVERSHFQIDVHRGVQDVVNFLDNCIKHDAECRRRSAANKSRRTKK